MAEHSLYGKRKLCYTEVTDFTDFRGIGNDPMYKRYDSVFSVISKCIPEKYRDFLAQPLYDDVEDQISWYIREWINTPARLSELNPEEAAKYIEIRDNTLSEYKKVLPTLKGEDYQILSGALANADCNDFLFCYDDKVSVVAWGMMPDTNSHRVLGTIIHGFEFQKRRKIRFDEGAHGSFKTKIDGQMTRLDGSVLTERDLPPTIIADEGYSFKCWDPNPIGFKVTGDMVFTALYEKIIIPEEAKPETITIRFEAGEHGRIIGDSNITIEKGGLIDGSKIPSIDSDEGYRFIGWDHSTEGFVDNDEVFIARYDTLDVDCYFEAGENGSLTGENHFVVPFGSTVDSSRVPSIKPRKGYKFTGWDTPLNTTLRNDTTFHAQYEKEERIPWWKKLWLFFKGKGCLKWLLWLLLLLILLFLLSNIFRSCNGGGIGGGGILPGLGGDDGVVPSEEVITDDGRSFDDNGSSQDIFGDNGSLPDNNVVAPIMGGDGTTPPIIQNPGVPDIIANRLNIYFEDENTDLNSFASSFKELYPGNDYKIIGADDNVKMIQIQMPEDRRDYIRENLNSQMPDFKFFIVDESIMVTGYTGQNSSQANAGWHLKAINLKEGWNITKGSRDIIVAIVDDGIDANHDILKDRIVDAYNVFTQNNHLSKGEGHGTHVAGLAVGSDKKFSEGVSGVAPKCKLMPVQVFDNGLCTFSSVTSGIMYAIHHGADVINVSIAPKFSGLDVLPEEAQIAISETQFKNEEKVWRKIIATANNKNTVLVLAVGNDNVLASIPPECRTNNTLNVSAVNKDFKVTEFTNYGVGSNISAPGQEISSSYPDNSYAVFDGTSMAAPIIAGTVALLKSINKDITVNEVLAILQQSGRGVTGNVPPMVQVDRALIMQRDGTVAPFNNQEEINNESDSSAQQTNYDEIRRMIEVYKQKISELEQMLPENNGR